MPYYQITERAESMTNMPRLHSHDFYELYFLLKGNKDYFFQSSLYKLHENTLVVIKPYSLHKFDGGPYERIGLEISPDCLSIYQKNFLDKLADMKVISFSPKTMDKITKQLNILIKINKIHTEQFETNFFIHFGLLLYLLKNHLNQNVNTISLNNKIQDDFMHPTVLKILDYIRMNFTKSFQITDLCTQFGISKTWLTSCFKKATNDTVMNFKLTMQINYAKEMLRNTKKSLSEISTLAGFSSLNYFSLIFKKQVGISPLNYRHCIKNEK